MQQSKSSSGGQLLLKMGLLLPVVVLAACQSTKSPNIVHLPPSEPMKVESVVPEKMELKADNTVEEEIADTDEAIPESTEEQIVDADSSKDPEEIDQLIPDTKIGIEGKFALCEDSIYINEWQRAFDENWKAENASKFKSRPKLESALRAARSQGFLKLLYPAINTQHIDFPVVVTPDVIKWMQYFQTRGRGAFVTWLQRAEDVLPKMIPVLREHGLPEDLVYLAMIESGFNNRAFSSAKAAGTWQFMRATGKQYGLRINDFVDERKDPAKSTRAAAEYLTNLYIMFGDWHLAAASYNAGEGRVQRAQRKSEETDFWSLSENSRLPNETRNYVPKLLAAMIISKSPEKFGFDVSTKPGDVKFKTVKLTRSVALADLGKAIEVDVKVLENLNPELRVGVTPPGGSTSQGFYELRVPEGQLVASQQALDSLPEPSRFQRVVAKLRQRQTVGQIANRYGVGVEALLDMNPSLRSNSRLNKGQTINIPVRLGSGQLERLASLENPSKKKFKRSARITYKGKSTRAKRRAQYAIPVKKTSQSDSGQAIRRTKRRG